MRFHKIDVDDEVMEVLKKNAEPFEDTPNTVLRRILLTEKAQEESGKKSQKSKGRGRQQSGGRGGRNDSKNAGKQDRRKDNRNTRKERTKPVEPNTGNAEQQSSAPGLDISKLNPLNFIRSAPKSLEQILEVIYQVRVLGYARPQATIHVAQKRHIKPRTVVDKYCGELHKKAEEIDELLAEPELKGFRDLLKDRFAKNKDVIDEFFRRLLATSEQVNPGSLQNQQKNAQQNGNGNKDKDKDKNKNKNKSKGRSRGRGGRGRGKSRSRKKN